MNPDTEERTFMGPLGGLYVYPEEVLGSRMASSLIFAYGRDDLKVEGWRFAHRHHGVLLFSGEK
jgi:hypothetical protein